MGGSELYLERLVEELGGGWCAGIVSLQDGPFVARLRSRGVPVEVIETGTRAGIVTGAWRLRRLLRRKRPSVVHANGIKAALVAAFATTGTRFPVVWVKHDFSWDGRLGRLVARRCAIVVGVSAAVIEGLGDGIGGKTKVVPHGLAPPDVDREDAATYVRALLGAKATAPVVGLVGRIHSAKGQLELIEALPRVITAQPDLRVALAGPADPHEPGYGRRLRERIDDLGLEHTVTLTGTIDDPLRFIAGCDAIAVPSVPDDRGMGREGFGLVGVEALAVGTPVVGYADGALPEVLGESAVLVEAGDRDALAEALARVVGDPALRRALADAGKERVRVRYRLDDMVASMKSVYREAAAGGA